MVLTIARLSQDLVGVRLGDVQAASNPFEPAPLPEVVTAVGNPYLRMPRVAAPLAGHRRKRNPGRCRTYGGGGGSAGVSARQGARPSAASQPSMM